MATVLMIAEKPSLAQSIATILGGGASNFTSVRKMGDSPCKVYEWRGMFQRTSVTFRMTSVCGHMYNVDFDKAYNDWDAVDPLVLFDCPIVKRDTPGLHMGRSLRAEARDVDYLVLWLDCDKEGENICFEVLDTVRGCLRKPRAGEQQVYRARFSSITDVDIRAAFNKLTEPDEFASRSVDARQELDLRIGCAFTRFQTRFFHNRFGNLDASTISYGPCQTPTLAFCVARHDVIQSFKPEPFWTLAVQVDAAHPLPPKVDARSYTEAARNAQTVAGERLAELKWERVRVFDKDVANVFLAAVRDEPIAVVTNVEEREKKKTRPVPLNTVEMLRVASARLGLSPHDAMDTAERLYTQGYLSYPRTETTHYADSFDLRSVVSTLASADGLVGSLARGLLERGGALRARAGKDAGDHPPITPTRMPPMESLREDQRRLFEYICLHFLATVLGDCVYAQRVVRFAVGSERFSLTARKMLQPGFTAALSRGSFGKGSRGIGGGGGGGEGEGDEEEDDDEEGDDWSDCQYELGARYRVAGTKLAERMTQPPDYLSESELISLMERHGIGTDASIPTHIANICDRRYVQLVSGRRLQPTQLGIVLVHGYERIDPELALPGMRSEVEKQLNLIANRQADFESVRRHVLTIFRAKFQFFTSNVTGMNELFESSFSTLAESGRVLSRCGKCRRYLRLVEAARGGHSRLHCPTCEDTYTLPANASVRLYKDQACCPLDHFELLLCQTSTSSRPFVVCPYCFNNPPFAEMAKHSACNMCTHPSCTYSLRYNGIAQCVACDEGGVIMLDTLGAPTKYRLVCNRCSLVLQFSTRTKSVSVHGSRSCSQCSASLVSITPIPEDASASSSGPVVGCVFCDKETIDPFLDSGRLARALASDTSRPRGAPMFGRGRGRGRGGRGRGRGRGGRGGSAF